MSAAIGHMREWLSGGAPPCQGGGRGFDPRLALLFYSGSRICGFRFFARMSRVISTLEQLPCLHGQMGQRTYDEQRERERLGLSSLLIE